MANGKHPVSEEELSAGQTVRLAAVREAAVRLAAVSAERRGLSGELTGVLEAACVRSGIARYKAAKAAGLSWPAVNQRLQRAGWRYVPDPGGGEGVWERKPGGENEGERR